MSRIRSIKPGFFKDEDLSELPIIARYVFSGLWCQADREGRMEDRPKLLKLEIVPWDDIDMNAVLDSLHPQFITRYQVDGKKYIQINNFCKHQIVPNREPDSVIPSMSCTGTVPVQYQTCTGTVPVKAEGEREGNKEKTFPASGKPDTAPPVKKKPDPRHGWFLRWFVWSASHTTGATYKPVKADAGIVRDLLRFPVHELTGRACAYLLMTDDQRFPRGSPSFRGLAAMIDQLAGSDTAEIDRKATERGLLPPPEIKLADFTPWENT